MYNKDKFLTSENLNQKKKKEKRRRVLLSYDGEFYRFYNSLE